MLPLSGAADDIRRAAPIRTVADEIAAGLLAKLGQFDAQFDARPASDTTTAAKQKSSAMREAITRVMAITDANWWVCNRGQIPHRVGDPDNIKDFGSLAGVKF